MTSVRSRRKLTPVARPEQLPIARNEPDMGHDPMRASLRGSRPGPPPITHTDVLWLIISVLLSLATRIPFFNIPMIHDEGGYAYAARGWIEGTGQLYDDLWISRPQGIFFVYGLVFEFLGTGVWALRFTAWVFAALTVIAVWFLGRRWTAPRIANLAAVLSALLLAWPSFEGYTANAEVFMGMPAAFAALWLLRMSQQGWSSWQLAGVGVLSGFSTLLKPSGIVMLFVAWGFIWLVDDAPRQERLKRCAWVLLGIGLIGVITFIHGYTLGWDDFLYATVTYRLTLQSSATVSLFRHIWAIGSLTYTSAPLVGILLLIGMFRIRLPLRPTMPGVYRARPAFRLRWLGAWRVPRRPQDAGGLLILLWIIGSVLGIAMGGDWWSHYMIQIVPPLSLWVAWNVDGIVRALRRWRRALVVAMLSVLLLLPYAIIVDGYDSVLERLYGHPGYPAQDKVAQYIREHSDPDDTIYVAFDQAAIYYLADRKPAYRHLYDQELRALPDSYADIIEIISGPNRPLYIVSTLHPGPFPDDSRAFWREVSRYYELETMIDGVPIYRAKGTIDPAETP
jgi:4-amino-4-deoxy-L-arabinose transferase-like glycosyltransferase